MLRRHGLGGRPEPMRRGLRGMKARCARGTGWASGAAAPVDWTAAGMGGGTGRDGLTIHCGPVAKEAEEERLQAHTPHLNTWPLVGRSRAVTHRPGTPTVSCHAEPPTATGEDARPRVTPRAHAPREWQPAMSPAPETETPQAGRVPSPLTSRRGGKRRPNLAGKNAVGFPWGRLCAPCRVPANVTARARPLLS